MRPLPPYQISYHFADGKSQVEKPCTKLPDIEKMVFPNGTTQVKISCNYPLEHRILRARRLEMETKAGKGEIRFPTTYFPDGKIMDYKTACDRVADGQQAVLFESAMNAITYANDFLKKDFGRKPEQMFFIYEKGANRVHIFNDNYAVLVRREKAVDGKIWEKINRREWDDRMRKEGLLPP